MNKKTFLRAVSGLVGFACIIPLTLQAAIPNLKGTWTITTVQGVTYSDVLGQLATPTFFSGAPSEQVYITDQQGRVFAGYYMESNGTNKEYIVGVIMPDNSISMQTHTNGSKQFWGGKFSVVNGKQTLKVYFQGYTRLDVDPPDAFIEAAYIEMRKTSSSVPAR